MRISLAHMSIYVCVFFSAAIAIQYTPVLKIKSGPIRGVINKLNTGGTIRKYLGIPFAKAERFGEPTNPEPWSDVKDVTTAGKMCPQPALLGNTISEDCLNLNVLVPEGAGSSLPVMVWIHGGAFIFGGNSFSDRRYIASFGDVIVVAINYRLNVFGFLATGNDDGDIKGNFGLMDQVFALKWLQQNINAFGGNPNKVTIIGLSAGGVCINHLVLSPMAKGLFHHAIIQSGTSTAMWAYNTYSEALQVAKKIGRDAGCNDIKTLVDCMKKKSVKDIVDAVAKSFETGWYFPPVVGGSFLPADSPEALYNMTKINVKVMIGSTNDEGTVITDAVPGVGSPYFKVSNGFTRADFISALHERKHIFTRGQNKVIEEAMLYRYTDWNNVTNGHRNRRMFLDMIGDSMFVAPAVKTAKALAKSSVETYMYHLRHRFENFFSIARPVAPWVGAFHAADLPIFFGQPFQETSPTNQSSVTTKDGNFSRALIRMWTNFAKTGNPNKPANIGIVWPQYDLKQQQFMVLQPNMAVQAKLRSDYVAFWNTFVPAALKYMPKTASPADGSETISNGLFTVLVLVSLLVLKSLLFS